MPVAAPASAGRNLAPGRAPLHHAQAPATSELGQLELITWAKPIRICYSLARIQSFEIDQKLGLRPTVANR